MKISAQNLVSITLALVLVGCQSQHVAYHSTASVPYFTRSTSTQMELIGEEPGGAFSTPGYVVFAATDNQKTSYVLLAPEGISGYSFKSANIGRAVPLPKKQLNVLIDGLNRTLELWGDTNKEREGAFYEFLHAPEQDVEKVSANVAEWTASVRFTASNTPDGPTARLILGDSPTKELQYLVEFDKREEVKTLRDLLQKARGRLGKISQR